MRTRLTLQPHQDGAKQLQALYGDRLVRVRYRYDEQRKKRIKTVELIVEESNWEPLAYPLSAPVGIRIGLPEGELRRRVKDAGGRWDSRRGLWVLRYDQVIALGLTDRIASAEG
ncbi:MAG: hypothetical protein AB7G75_32925 [Candidatus Binatia bacterium]